MAGRPRRLSVHSVLQRIGSDSTSSERDVLQQDTAAESDGGVAQPAHVAKYLHIFQAMDPMQQHFRLLNMKSLEAATGVDSRRISEALQTFGQMTLNFEQQLCSVLLAYMRSKIGSGDAVPLMTIP